MTTGGSIPHEDNMRELLKKNLVELGISQGFDRKFTESSIFIST